jgi:1-acyl-sn-glycerol-3-phosphate acyltransferase
VSSDRALRAVAGSRTDRIRPAIGAPDETPVVDEWGASPLAVRLARTVADRRWQIQLGGLEHLPRRGGALLITNPRSLAMVPPMVALALGERLDRTVRFAGVPDLAPANTILRRVGGVLALPDEVESALADGDLVVVGAAGDEWPVAGWVRGLLGRDRRAGTVPVAFVAAARRAGVPIHPVAAATSPVGRAARIEIVAAVRPRLDRRGPLAAAELAERVQQRLQQRLDEITGGGA